MTNEKLLDAIGKMFSELNGKVDLLTRHVGKLSETQREFADELQEARTEIQEVKIMNKESRDELGCMNQRMQRIESDIKSHEVFRTVSRIGDIDTRLKHLEAKAT